MLRRDHWQRRVERLDPHADALEISRVLSLHEFPWDVLQALSFALLRTYAVPSIGSLLHGTGEFTERTQKRYDDTGILLEHVLEFGLADPRARDAVRRVNQMHRSYPISNDDMRYVLATFVVVPKRWIDEYGYRRLTSNEIEASTGYYLDLGRHLGIRDLPQDFAGFERLLDEYERAHFGFDPGGRAVADATIELFCTLPLNRLVPAWLMRRFVRGIMDDPLRNAFRYPAVTVPERTLYRGLLKVRGRVLRLFPARREPKYPRDFGHYRSYPDGYRTGDLGTFPTRKPASAPSSIA